MQSIILVFGIGTAFLGFEVFNFGGLISRYSAYTAYIFFIAHIFVIIGLYKKTLLAKKILLIESLLFIILIIYFMSLFSLAKVSPGPSYAREPTLNDLIISLKYGLPPLIFLVTSIMVVIKSFRSIDEERI